MRSKNLQELRGRNSAESASFSVRVGEIVALAGDNGAGKSTLIKILSGSATADGGEICFDGKTHGDPTSNDATQLGIQTVYQDLALCDNLDVVDNIFLGRELRGPWWRGYRVDRPTMERLDLHALWIRWVSKFKDRHTHGLSVRWATPMRRGVPCDLGDPGIVILDEPTAALG